MKTFKINATYTSIYDRDIIVRVPCQYDPIKKEVSDILSVDIEGLQCLEEEYVELEDGTIIESKDLKYNV